MTKLNLSDFYYGSALSWIVNDDIKPALIDSGPNRKKYEFSTNEKDFILITRYSGQRNTEKNTLLVALLQI